MDKNQGYEIIKAVMLENGRGFALGHHPTAPSPYVTWACYDDKDGQRQYEWGHYGSDRAALEQDFAARVQEYQRLYNVDVRQVEAPGLYKYYSTQRPVDIGTFPKPPRNAPDEIVNYDQRVPVENGSFLAWGHLTYTRPLTKRQASDYELRPAPDNPDRPRSIREQMKTAAKQAEAGRGQSAPKKMPLTGATDRRIFMEQERNSNRNAELAMEQNGNMIDGIINNLPAPPPAEKPLDKVREHPPKRRSREREER